VSGALLELVDVGRSYGADDVVVHALRSVSLEILPGDFVAIIGPSGSGKSTMLGLLGCLDQPTTGAVWVGGSCATELPELERTLLRGRTIGFVFQQFHLIPHLTALGNVETALLYRGLRPAERSALALDALEQVGLGHRHDHRPVQMSGGEQQRVAIARAIVGDPLMVLADEPTGALDTANAENVMQIFADLRAPTRAIVIVTHDLEVAARADRVVSMRDGRIVSDERAAG
jgi:putative ABC transport system ATP-binding protein